MEGHYNPGKGRVHAILLIKEDSGLDRVNAWLSVIIGIAVIEPPFLVPKGIGREGILRYRTTGISQESKRNPFRLKGSVHPRNLAEVIKVPRSRC
jgi:hypothetical protein